MPTITDFWWSIKFVPESSKPTNFARPNICIATMIYNADRLVEEFSDECQISSAKVKNAKL